MGEALRGELGAGDRGSLVAGALSDLEIDERAIVTLGPRSIAKRRADAIRADFDQGRTVRIDGWVLSRTEVRLAALAAHSAA